MDIVYFELNNWFRGRDYPDSEPFITWCGDDMNLYFNDEEWVKENKLCVVLSIIDMSINWCITAPKEWVEKNCPDLLSDKSIDTTFTYTDSVGSHEHIETYRYSDFIRTPDEDGVIRGRFDTRFLEYSEENIGITYEDDD